MKDEQVDALAAVTLIVVAVLGVMFFLWSMPT